MRKILTLFLFCLTPTSFGAGGEYLGQSEELKPPGSKRSWATIHTLEKIGSKKPKSGSVAVASSSSSAVASSSLSIDEELNNLYIHAMRLYYGDGLEKDESAALNYLRDIVRRGHREAQYSLGMHFWISENNAINNSNARELFALAAEQGHPQALFEHAFCCYHGIGGDKRLPIAFRDFQTAAMLGHRDAAFQLSLMIYKEEGLISDKSIAKHSMKSSADRGCRLAEYEYGLILYQEGKQKQSFQYMESAAEKGYRNAMYACAFMYAKGQGVKLNVAKVAEYLDKANSTPHRRSAVSPFSRVDESTVFWRGIID